MFGSQSFIVALFCLALAFFAGCSERNDKNAKPQILRLATTTSTVGSGLIDKLLPVFEKDYGIKAEILSKGTGAALKLTREGEADVALVHAREAENKFILDGWGVNRMDVMYNDFVLLGPSEDPARAKDAENVVDALKRIASNKAAFFSRGDNSGTHMRERQLWSLTQVFPEKALWHKSSGTGMLDTLKLASKEKAYVLSDRSTYLFNRGNLKLEIVNEGDNRLFNPYGVIAANPAKVPNVNFDAAMKFIDFITSDAGQGIIREHGKKSLGQPLFIPMAVKK